MSLTPATFTASPPALGGHRQVMEREGEITAPRRETAGALEDFTDLLRWDLG